MFAHCWCVRQLLKFLPLAPRSDVFEFYGVILNRITLLRLSDEQLSFFVMPEFSLSERLENAHDEPIWAVTHVKENMFATGSLDESVKLW